MRISWILDLVLRLASLVAAAIGALLAMAGSAASRVARMARMGMGPNASGPGRVAAWECFVCGFRNLHRDTCARCGTRRPGPRWNGRAE